MSHLRNAHRFCPSVIVRNHYSYEVMNLTEVQLLDSFVLNTLQDSLKLQKSKSIKRTQMVRFVDCIETKKSSSRVYGPDGFCRSQ